jgi:hypothetical protein
MTPSVVADSIVNLCGAIGLAVAMLALDRRDPGGPLTRRLLFLLGIVAALFFIRGLAWWQESAWLDRLSLMPAASVPLGALIVTEGILRRHAPRPVKQIAVACAVVLGVGGALGLEAWSTSYAIALALSQLGGFVTCAALLALRDRSQLHPSENRSIARLAVGALLVIPFVVTDFQALAPDMPVRLGPLGALLVVTAVLIAGSSGETQRQGIALAALRIVSAALLGAAAAFIADDLDAAQIMRFSAVAVAGVLTIGLMTDTLRAYFEAHAPGMLNSVAASPATTREELLAELLRQPLFESARRFRAADLAAWDPPLLRDLLASRPVLRRADAPWGLSPADPAVERVKSLLATHSATHIVVLSHDPVDLLILSVPVMLADPASETALALVRRLLAMSPESA